MLSRRTGVQDTVTATGDGDGKSLSGAGTSGTCNFLEEAEEAPLGEVTALCWKPQLRP